MSEILHGQPHDRNALILYGSESGNSQDAADELGRMAERLHFKTWVSEMDLIDLNELHKYTIVIFTISTTGLGEFPRNSRKFWTSLLRKRLPPDCLSHVYFTSFGLGDSSYAQYNFAAKKLHKRLKQLGANEIYPRGEGDERHEEGIDGTFLSWLADLKRTILTLYPLPAGKTPIPDDALLPPKITLVVNENYSKPIENSHSSSESVSEDESGFIGEGDQVETEKALVLSPQGRRRQHSHLNHNKNSESSFDSKNNNNNKINLPINPSSHPSQQNTTTTAENMEPTPPPRDQIKYVCKDPLISNNQPLPEHSRLQTKEHDLMVARIISNKRVTPPNHWQDVRQIIIKISRTELKVGPGDTILIYPSNFPRDVQTIIDLQGWNELADKPLLFQLTESKTYVDPLFVSGYGMPGLAPKKDSTLRDLLTYNIDFNAIPKRPFFTFISRYTDDKMHKERLLEFQDPKYTDEFFDYTSRPRRSILEVLQDFSSVKIPMRDVCMVLPIIRPREFSINSGGSLHDKEKDKSMQIDLLVAIVKYHTMLRKVRNGLCSRYLASIPRGSKINIRVKHNPDFYKHPRNNPELPLILIGSGTGIAPIRSLVWERASEPRNYPKKQRPSFGKAIIIQGCRNKEADFFHSEEWKDHSNRYVAKVFPAFSRDNPDGTKVYVQDVIREQGKLVAQMLLEKALVYVCGSSGNMPKAVREAMLEVLVKHGGMDEDGAEMHIKGMEKFKRYFQETW